MRLPNAGSADVPSALSAKRENLFEVLLRDGRAYGALRTGPSALRAL